MPKATKAETKERAAVGRERTLALTLRALMDAVIPAEGYPEHVQEAVNDAVGVLSDLGYADLESIPTRVNRLNEQLKAALERADAGTISHLGEELLRAQLGKPPSKPKGEKVAAVGGA